MSTILRALERVEKERTGDGEMGALREGVVPPGEPLVREARGRWRVGIAASLAGLMMAFFVWWMIPTEEATRPSARPPAEAARSAEPPAGPSARTAPSPSRPGELLAGAARTPVPSERIRGAPPPQVAAAPPPRFLVEETPPRAEAAEAPAPVAAEPPTASRRAAAEVPIPAPLEKPIPPKRVAEVPPPPAPPPAARPATRPPPETAAAPAPARPAPASRIRPPKVTVHKTVWHPTPERRMARIELQGHKGPLELHEGDAVGTLVVAEIQPSGVVFLHGGDKLHRKVGPGR